MKICLKVMLLMTLLLGILSCGKQADNKSTDAKSEDKKTEQKQETAGSEKTIVLATTTSTQDSGLLDYLLPEFKKDTGIDVKVVAKGTGEALKLGESGDADVLMVHAKAKEEEFIKAGFGTERIEFMYNDFILVGPSKDGLELKKEAPNDIEKAFKLIADKKAEFISRGDESGTDTKEKGIWKTMNIVPASPWYIEAGKGMGAVLQMADEKNAYTLSDRATYLSMKDKLELQILVENDKKLYNQYSVIRLNYEKLGIKNKDGAEEFIKWITSDKALELIKNFGVEKYGQPLFIPNFKK